MLGDRNAIRDSEVAYTVKAIINQPGNESPWRYLRGLYGKDTESFTEDPQIVSVCLQVIKSKSNFIHALNMLLDLLSHGLQFSQEIREAVCALNADSDSGATDSNLAITICTVLEREDPIRQNYWRWRRNMVR